MAFKSAIKHLIKSKKKKEKKESFANKQKQQGHTFYLSHSRLLSVEKRQKKRLQEEYEGFRWLWGNKRDEDETLFNIFIHRKSDKEGEYKKKEVLMETIGNEYLLMN